MVQDVALVLGGGGAAGQAWQIGVIAGLAEAGLDLTEAADLVVGTSSGSTTAAHVRSGIPAADLLASVLSAACPGVSTSASGRQRRSAARWTLLVSPRASDPALPPRAGPGGADAAVGARPARTPQLAGRRPPRQFARFPWPLFPRRGPCQRRQDLRFHHHPGRVVMGAGHRGVHANQRHVRLAAPSSLGDHPLHQRGEAPGLPPYQPLPMPERTSAPPAWPCVSRALTSEKARTRRRFGRPARKPMRPGANPTITGRRA